MGTRNYDMVYVVKPDLDPDTVNTVVERMSRRIQDQGGTIEVVDIWGKKRSSYRMGKFREGLYVHTRFALEPTKVAEIKRSAALTEELLRATLTIAVGPTPQPKTPAAPPQAAPAPQAEAPQAPPAPQAEAPQAPPAVHGEVPSTEA